VVNLAEAHFNRDGPAYQRVLSGRGGGRRQTAHRRSCRAVAALVGARFRIQTGHTLHGAARECNAPAEIILTPLITSTGVSTYPVLPLPT
jgi:hypothetical protein